MDFTSDEVGIVIRMIEFGEEHFVAFAQRCEEAGYTEEETDALLESIKGKMYA